LIAPTNPLDLTAGTETLRLRTMPPVHHMPESVASFLSRISSGFQVIMACSRVPCEVDQCIFIGYECDSTFPSRSIADSIAADDEDDTLYVRDNLLSVKQGEPVMFARNKFHKMLEKVDERPFIAEALLNLEDMGIPLFKVVAASCVCEDDFDPIAVPVFRMVAKHNMTLRKLFKAEPRDEPLTKRRKVNSDKYATNDHYSTAECEWI